MEVVGSYLMDQVLKMQWLSDLVTMLVGAFGLDVNSQWGGTIHFLIYDTVKIVILLCVMIFIISYIQSYFPPERSKRILGRFKGIGGNIVGAFAWHGDAVLRLLFYPAVHRVHARGAPARGDVLLPHLVSHGGHRLHHPHHEHLRPARGPHLHGGGTRDRSGGGYRHSAPPHG